MECVVDGYIEAATTTRSIGGCGVKGVLPASENLLNTMTLANQQKLSFMPEKPNLSVAMMH